MFNPDYPTDNNAGFAQHTYQPNNMMDTYYWNGMNGSFGSSAYDSRRNMYGPTGPMGPMNPVNPFNTFGQQQAATTIPENQVQPFSSYPPAGPQPQGLNSMVGSDSRRAQVTGNNPWAPQQSTFNQPTPTPAAWNPTAPTWGYNPQPFGGCDPFYANKIDMNTSALYQNSGIPTFEKRQAWDNYYTTQRQLQPPQVNWAAYQQNQNPNYCGNGMYGAPTPPPYPASYSAPSVNWKDKAIENWSEIGKL